MTDLSTVLPAFPTAPYAALLPALEHHRLTTTDLLTLDAPDIAKRAHLPVPDVQRLCAAILGALQRDLSLGHAADGDAQVSQERQPLRRTGEELAARWETISTLDEGIDAALGGGVPTGYLTEITGESGAGKTQLLLTLLLSAQLPPPYGLGKQTLYISTESPLSTQRLTQILATHPLLRPSPSSPSSPSPSPPPPSLTNILTLHTPTLESQDHILRYQLPTALARHPIALVVIDSITANFRAEFDRSTGGGSHGANMAARTAELLAVGALLRGLARDYGVAIVVANQVGDRFAPLAAPPMQMQGQGQGQGRGYGYTQSSPLARRGGVVESSVPRRVREPLTLDYQQRFFTGWGDECAGGGGGESNLKTPSLGLVWTSQVAARVAMVKEMVYEEGEMGGWRRWVKVVFAAWTAPAGGGKDGDGDGRGVEVEVWEGGVRSVEVPGGRGAAEQGRCIDESAE